MVALRRAVTLLLNLILSLLLALAITAGSPAAAALSLAGLILLQSRQRRPSPPMT